MRTPAKIVSCQLIRLVLFIKLSGHQTMKLLNSASASCLLFPFTAWVIMLAEALKMHNRPESSGLSRVVPSCNKLSVDRRQRGYSLGGVIRRSSDGTSEASLL